MRQYLTGAALAALSLIVPAQAGNAPFGGLGYIGIRGSYVAADDSKTTSVFIDDDRTHQDGWGASGVLGFVLTNAVRMELEGGYRTNDLESVTVVRNTLDPLTQGQSFQAEGHVDLGLAMVNVFYDLHFGGLPFLPWVGAGVGGANVSYEVFYDYGDPVSPVLAKDTDWQFAYQLMTGVTFPVAKSVSISAGYRYFETEDMVFVDAYGDEFKTELTNHSLDIGVQWHL